MTECGLLNLATCLPAKFVEYFQQLLNAPLQPLLYLVEDLLVEPVEISLILPVWAIIIYIISMFYGLFFIYSGFSLMVSGYDVEKRVRAKLWFKRIFLMIISVQSSYLIYKLLIEISSSLSISIIKQVSSNFFLLTADSFINLGLSIIFTASYVAILLMTIITLSFRYLLVFIGVVYFPIGLFFYFVPPLKVYGKFIINLFLAMIFFNFFATLVLLISSLLMEVPMFTNFKMLLMLTSFLIVNLMMIFLVGIILVKSLNNMPSFSNIKSAAGFLV
jgi:hypothetical protein